jgi:hypothetical protein
MSLVRQAFEARNAEVKSFLDLLAAIEEKRITLHHSRSDYSDSFLVMKANVFLLSYNLVEATIRICVTSIYDKMAGHRPAFSRLRSEFQDVWLRQRASTFPIETLTRDSQFKLIKAVASHLVAASPVELKVERLSLSGNIDADNIRELFDKHGMRLTVHASAKGGAELRTVKTKRNALAHGEISFAECGREYTVADLKRIHEQVRVFLSGVVASADRYAKRDAFLA